MGSFDNPGCDAAGSPLKTLLRSVGKTDSLLRDTSTMQSESSLGNSMRSARPLSKTGDRDINEFVNQRAEMQTTLVDPDYEIWASEFVKFDMPVNPGTVYISQSSKALLLGRAGEATVPLSKPPVKLGLSNDPIYGWVATAYSSTAIPGTDAHKSRVSWGRTSRNNKIQSCKTLPGQRLGTLPGEEQYIDFVHQQVVPSLKNGIQNRIGEYFVDWTVNSSMPAPGSYERPREPNELMVIADSKFYRDPLSSKPLHDEMVKGCLRVELEPRAISRILMRCYRDLLSKKSSFFLELFPKTEQLDTVVLNNELEEVVIEMIHFIEIG